MTPTHEVPEKTLAIQRRSVIMDRGFDLQFDDEHFDDEDPAILAMVALA